MVIKDLLKIDDRVIKVQYNLLPVIFNSVVANSLVDKLDELQLDVHDLDEEAISYIIEDSDISIKNKEYLKNNLFNGIKRVYATRHSL